MNVRPPRTLGIAIAILASALAFGCLPLTQVGFILLVQLRIQNADLLTQTTEGEVAPIAVGGGFSWRGTVQSAEPGAAGSPVSDPLPVCVAGTPFMDQACYDDDCSGDDRADGDHHINPTASAGRSSAGDRLC